MKRGRYHERRSNGGERIEAKRRNGRKDTKLKG